MSARNKLNVAYFNGCLLVAALFGLTAKHWSVFWAALAVTVGCGVYTGDIRPAQGGLTGAVPPVSRSLRGRARAVTDFDLFRGAPWLPDFFLRISEEVVCNGQSRSGSRPRRPSSGRSDFGKPDASAHTWCGTLIRSWRTVTGRVAPRRDNRSAEPSVVFTCTTGRFHRCCARSRSEIAQHPV